MQLKDCITLTIESIAFGGEGVGRVDNFVVFVPFAAPGDELEVEITGLKKKFSRAKITKIIKPSELRAIPLCRYYEKCGGCCYQHLNYKSQLSIKRNQVKETFQKIGKFSCPQVAETIPSPQMYHYRGKAQLHTESGASAPKIGFLDITGGNITDIERCEIMEETINNQVTDLRKKKQFLDKDHLTIWSETTDCKAEKNEQIIRMVKGKEFLVPREGFFQANMYLTDRLVDEVCRLATTHTVNNIVDAYCGSGLFSIFLSPYARNVIGIETNEQSIKSAQINAEREGAQNIKFIRGEVERKLAEYSSAAADKIDLLVLDPPRTGCEGSVLQIIASLRPQKVIYISCNPATQARDIRYLCENGYDLLSLLPLDMFPQTAHIEVIGHLKLR